MRARLDNMCGKQGTLRFSTRGGKRRGAGRPPRREKAGVSHEKREALTAHHPVLVTMKVRSEVWRLRRRRVVARLVPALRAERERHVRVVQFTIQHDHLHLLVEARDAETLARGVQGLAVRIARRINALMERHGKVFADRYHARVLRSPRQVRNALAYVLGNARKHGERLPPRGVDPCSSAATFDGWEGRITASSHRLASAVALVCVEAKCWLLRVGWRRAGGRLDPDHRPGAV